MDILKAEIARKRKQLEEKKLLVSIIYNLHKRIRLVLVLNFISSFRANQMRKSTLNEEIL